jgi:hypothetical protein
MRQGFNYSGYVELVRRKHESVYVSDV